MPDLTKAQLTVIAGQVVALAVAFGASLSPDQQKELISAAVVFGSVLVWIDKEIRANRARNADKIAQAEAAAKPIEVTVTPTVNAPPKPADAKKHVKP